MLPPGQCLAPAIAPAALLGPVRETQVSRWWPSSVPQSAQVLLPRTCECVSFSAHIVPYVSSRGDVVLHESGGPRETMGSS